MLFNAKYLSKCIYFPLVTYNCYKEILNISVIPQLNKSNKKLNIHKIKKPKQNEQYNTIFYEITKSEVLLETSSAKIFQYITT